MVVRVRFFSFLACGFMGLGLALLPAVARAQDTLQPPRRVQTERVTPPAVVNPIPQTTPARQRSRAPCTLANAVFRAAKGEPDTIKFVKIERDEYKFAPPYDMVLTSHRSKRVFVFYITVSNGLGNIYAILKDNEKVSSQLIAIYSGKEQWIGDLNEGAPEKIVLSELRNEFRATSDRSYVPDGSVWQRTCP